MLIMDEDEEGKAYSFVRLKRSTKCNEQISEV